MSPVWYRHKAHRVFDHLWKEGHMTRTQAYRWLSKQFPDGIEHISEMDELDCQRLIERVRKVIATPEA